MTAEAEYRNALGAYLLGALDPGEEARLTEHLRSCPDCHAELLELGGVVADLAVLDSTADKAAIAGKTPPAASGAPTPALSAVPATPPDTDSGGATAVPRRHLFAVAAAAACLAVAGGVGFTAGHATGDHTAADHAPSAGPTPSTGVRTVMGRNATTTVTGHAVLTPAAWGTGIHLVVAGTQDVVAAGVRCTLLAVSRTGATDTAGSWTVPERSPTSSGEHLRASTAIPLRELSKLLVVTEDGQELLAVPV